jgi:hypothetical protein
MRAIHPLFAIFLNYLKIFEDVGKCLIIFEIFGKS